MSKLWYVRPTSTSHHYSTTRLPQHPSLSLMESGSVPGHQYHACLNSDTWELQSHHTTTLPPDHHGTSHHCPTTRLSRHIIPLLYHQTITDRIRKCAWPPVSCMSKLWYVRTTSRGLCSWAGNKRSSQISRNVNKSLHSLVFRLRLCIPDRVRNDGKRSL